ncbi:MAG: trypsin-like serine protease [Bacteroidota bacterium]
MAIKITVIKQNSIISWSLAACMFLTFSSGISRHDVDEKAYLNLAAEQQFDCVGQVFNETTAIGSCVLISDHFVLSAAHVFMDKHKKGVISAAKLYLVFNGQKVKVKNVILHPYYLDAATKGNCDIALIELEQAVNGIKPATVNTAFDELNSLIIGVGYGASGPADNPKLVSGYNKKIAGENVIDSIGGLQYSGSETLLLCDFDHPERKDCNKMGSPIPRPLEYVCSGGDSGGGIFRKNDKNWQLLGICSGGGANVIQLLQTGYYGQTMEWTRVSAFAGWINEHTQ